MTEVLFLIQYYIWVVQQTIFTIFKSALTSWTWLLQEFVRVITQSHYKYLLFLQLPIILKNEIAERSITLVSVTIAVNMTDNWLNLFISTQSAQCSDDGAQLTFKLVSNSLVSKQTNHSWLYTLIQKYNTAIGGAAVWYMGGGGWYHLQISNFALRAYPPSPSRTPSLNTAMELTIQQGS